MIVKKLKPAVRRGIVAHISISNERKVNLAPELMAVTHTAIDRASLPIL